MTFVYNIQRHGSPRAHTTEKMQAMPDPVGDVPDGSRCTRRMWRYPPFCSREWSAESPAGNYHRC